MKNSLENLIIAALMLISASLWAQPTITTQPVSRTNNVGDNAQFTVAATSTGTLTYQWQFNGTNISGGTSNALNVLISDISKAGTYRVRVSDTSNLTNTSSDATLSAFFSTRVKIAQWNFNSTTPDANTGTDRKS